MSETTKFTPSESPRQEAKTFQKEMAEFADSIAEKRALLKESSDTVAQPITLESDPQEAYNKLASLLNGDVMSQKIGDEIWDDEDVLQDFLIEFQETSPLPQKKKNEIIASIINKTNPNLDNAKENKEKKFTFAETKKRLGALAMKTLVKIKNIKKKDEHDTLGDIEEDSFSPEVQTKRDQIQERIDQLDAIDDKKIRTEALTDLAEKLMIERDFVDLAITAVQRIKKSTQHTGAKAKYVGRTKKFGKTHDAHDELLHKIATANSNNRFGVYAASQIDMPWYRNKVLQEVSDNATEEVGIMYAKGKQAHDNGQQHKSQSIIEEIQDTDYFEVMEEARKRVKGEYKLNVEIGQIKLFKDPAMVADIGLRYFLKKQKLLSEIAIENDDLKTAKSIKNPRLRRKAVKQIRKNLLIKSLQ